MRTVFALALSKIITAALPGIDPRADPCWLVCDEYKSDLSGLEADLCGSSASRCIAETQLCENLFLLDGALLNSEVFEAAGEPLTAEERLHPLTCAEARRMAAHRYIAPRRAPLAATRRQTDETAAPAEAPPQSFPGVRGISNVRSNCYMSTAFQILTHLHPVRAMLANVHEQHVLGLVEPNPFMQALLNLYNQMNVPGESPLSPQALRVSLHGLGYNRFTDGHSHVYQESIPEILDALQLSLDVMMGGAAAGGMGFVEQTFGVSVQRSNLCIGCGSEPLVGPQINTEKSIRLTYYPTAEGGGSASIPDLLRTVYGSVVESPQRCHDCDTRLFETTQISQLEEIVEIQIERSVLGLPITLPADSTIDFSPFLTPDSLSHANPLYRLVGIAHYRGRHYFAQFIHEGVWYEVDDHRVSRLDAPPSGESGTAQILYFARI